MNYEDFIILFEKRTPEKGGIKARCPAHDDSTPSLSISEGADGRIILICRAGCRTENIMSALGLKMKDLFPDQKRAFTPKPVKAVKPTEPNDVEPPKTWAVEKTYIYTDALGRDVFRVLRYKPKDFRQQRKDGDSWRWGMAGVELVLYNLPQVLKSKVIWVSEGEKDSENLAALGFCATTNVGGGGNWLDGYTETLKGKDVVICGDNDEKGREHVIKVFDSVSARAESVKIIKLPSIYKDVSELIEAQGTKSREMLMALEAAAVPHIGGVKMPVYSAAQSEVKYGTMAAQTESVSVNLADWLPSLRSRIRPLVPGSMVLIVGNTGSGKTLVLQNIAMSALRTKTLFFELELSEEELFERFMAIKNKCECVDVEQEYRKNGCFGEEIMMRAFPNLYICPEPRMTVDQMETIILKSELKMGGKPLLILIDYVQLVHGEGKSRYEKTSNIAEGLKAMAKATKTIVIVASQIDRASGRDGEIGLHSAKDSGALENSAGVVLSASRDEQDPTLLRLRILKSTKGYAGYEVLCNIDGAKATITERSRSIED